MSSLTSVLCGREIDNLGDEFGLGSSVPSTVELTEEQLAEMNSLPGNAGLLSFMFKAIVITFVSYFRLLKSMHLETDHFSPYRA